MKTFRKLEEYQINKPELSSIHGGGETVNTGRGYIGNTLHNGYDRMTVANNDSWVNVFISTDNGSTAIIGSGRS